MLCSRTTADPQGLVTCACLRLSALGTENIFLLEAYRRVNMYQLLIVQFCQLLAKTLGTSCLRQREDLKLRLEQILRNSPLTNEPLL